MGELDWLVGLPKWSGLREVSRSGEGNLENYQQFHSNYIHQPVQADWSDMWHCVFKSSVPWVAF